jgi:hypothetical protein
MHSHGHTHGQASYDSISVAAALLDEVRKVGFSMPSYVDLEVFVRVAVAVGTPAWLPKAKLENHATTSMLGHRRTFT